MMRLTNQPHKTFNSVDAAVAVIALMGFEDGETRVCVDPKGSGRCFVEVLDLDDGAVISRI
jgi:hypothetical protein